MVEHFDKENGTLELNKKGDIGAKARGKITNYGNH